MILVLHKWEIVTSLITQLLGEETVTVCASLPATLKEAMTGRYELILVDAEGFGGGIRSLSDHGKVVAVLASNTNGLAKECVEDGAAEIVFLGDSLGEIASGLEKARKGDPVSWQPLRYKQVARIAGVEVSQTQLDVLTELAKGKMDKEIAASLGKSIGYIRRVMRTLYRKTGTKGKVALAMWVTKQGVTG